MIVILYHLIKGTKVYGANKFISDTLAQDAYNKWMQEPEFGTISLQHDIRNATVVEIPPTLDILKSSSYIPVLLSQCTNTTLIYNDETIKKAGALTETANKIVRDVDNKTTISPNNDRTSTSNGFISKSSVIIAILCIII